MQRENNIYEIKYVIMPLKLMYVFILNYSGKTSRGFLRITRRKKKKIKTNLWNGSRKVHILLIYSHGKETKEKKKKEERKIKKKNKIK